MKKLQKLNLCQNLDQKKEVMQMSLYILFNIQLSLRNLQWKDWSFIL